MEHTHTQRERERDHMHEGQSSVHLHLTWCHLLNSSHPFEEMCVAKPLHARALALSQCAQRSGACGGLHTLSMRQSPLLCRH